MVYTMELCLRSSAAGGMYTALQLYELVGYMPCSGALPPGSRQRRSVVTHRNPYAAK